MYIEQIKYFLTIAEAGSVSKASKNLFISQQGMSNALLSLERELGFPLFIREKKNMLLTEDGKNFLPYAETFLKNYSDMLKFASDTHSRHEQDGQRIRIMAGPMISSILIKWVCESDLIAKYNLILCENTIADIDLAFASNQAHLGIFFLDEQQLALINKKATDYMDFIELFEDEVILCASKENPSINCNMSVDQFDGLLVEFNTTYYEFFNSTASYYSSVQTNNIPTHIELMKELDAFCLVTKKLYNLLYPDPNITWCPHAATAQGKFYLVRNKNMLSNEVIELSNALVDLIRENVPNR